MDKTMLVIYHANCADGVAAAWCFLRKFGEENVTLHPGVYNETPPDVTDKHVYLVDFSYPAAVVAEMMGKAKKVNLIDHHKTALEALEPLRASGLDFCNSSLTQSGAMLAWNYLFPNDCPPYIIRHIQDRDLWKFDYYDTKAVMAYLFAIGVTIQNIEYLANALQNPENRLSVATKGEILLLKQGQIVKEIAKEVRTIYYEGAGMRIVTVNCTYQFASDVGSHLASKYGIAASYYDTEEHRVFSLRSDGSYDCGAIAKIYGGGGHPKAAGFKVTRGHILARL